MDADDADDDRCLLGRYRLLHLVATGGMAEVWEGTDEILTRPVAVKLLHAHLAADEAFRERFRREAVAAARLAHPNVVATFDTGEDEDTPFIVMELVRGRTLRDVIHDGPVRPATAAAIAAQVADALAAAHSAGLVHRDIKPGNILLCDGMAPGAPASVKVADFGIARAATETTDVTELTQPGTLLGTTKYLSPEQVQGDDPDARSDLYALGVVLYEMLTGRAPFNADTAMATAMAHVHNEPMRPRQVRAGIPRSLEHVVLKAMAKDPADRYQSAAEVAAALRAVDLGEDDAVPAVVRDPTPPAGAAAFRDTERSWLVPAAVIVLAAAGLIAFALVVGGSDVGRDLIDRARRSTNAAKTPVTVPIAGIEVLDPAGGGEKNDRLPLAHDGRDDTSWSTQTYTRPDFGGLKPHLGLILDLGRSVTVSQLTVNSPTSGWDAEVYVAEQPAPDLPPWGKQRARKADLGGSATFENLDAKGRYVLLLFTRLGDDNKVEVAELTVQG